MGFRVSLREESMFSIAMCLEGGMAGLQEGRGLQNMKEEGLLGKQMLSFSLREVLEK